MVNKDEIPGYNTKTSIILSQYYKESSNSCSLWFLDESKQNYENLDENSKK